MSDTEKLKICYDKEAMDNTLVVEDEGDSQFYNNKLLF